MAIESLNPATGERLRTFAPESAEAIEGKLGRAAAAFRAWSRRPVRERAAVVARAGELLELERQTFGRLMTLEMGKLAAAAADEAAKCATACRYYAEHGEAFLQPENVASADASDAIRFDPLGAVLAVMPWNFPFWQVIRFAAPALVAGNVGLLKHASNVPQCALALEDLFRRAGAPEGVFQTLLIGSERALALIADDRVAAVTVTGSEAAGRAIGAAAGQHLKKSVLELGGSDPFLVLASADLERAIATAVKARNVNSGQSCIAAKRFIVADAVYDRFAASFAAAMGALKVGDPGDPDTEVGPLATAAIRDGVADQVARSVAAGARVLTGGRHRRPRVLLPADRTRGRPRGRARRARGGVRPGGAALPRRRDRRGAPSGQRDAVRAGRRRLHARAGRGRAARPGARGRQRLHQPDGRLRYPLPLRRRQALRPRPGALALRSARVREHQDGPRQLIRSGPSKGPAPPAMSSARRSRATLDATR
jgi:succinate-semialdehyde dehydrogenase/glutarate-semialdehyde dehydrogenase